MVVAGAPWVSFTSPDLSISGVVAGVASVMLIRPHFPEPSLATMIAQKGFAAVGSETLDGVINPFGDWTWITLPGAIVSPPGPSSGRKGTGHTTCGDPPCRETNRSGSLTPAPGRM